MKSLQNPNLNVKPWLIAMLLVAASSGTQAQAPDSDNDAKLLRCQQNATDLIWLDREKLRARCGLWSRTYTTKTAKGEIERIVYSRYFVVTLRDGVVQSVRQKKQIFTGLKKVAKP